MKTISAKDARDFLGIVLSAAQREPITIEENGVAAAVLLSPEDYMMLEAIEAAYVAQFADAEAEVSLLDSDGDSDRILHSTLAS